MRHATITGTGSFVPARVLTNADLSAMLGEDVDAFVSGTLGIRERRVCAPDESAADLAEEAARRAMADAGLGPEEIDLLIVSTDTPEYVSPATSSVLHGRLGLRRGAGTFDLNSACSGFATALDVAWKYVRADERYERVLVVAVYAMSKFVDYADKKTATIFADGAGAVVLEASDAEGILASELFADGSLSHGMGVFAGGTAEPVTEDVLRQGYRNRLRFVEKYPKEVNEEGWPRIVRSVLSRIGRKTADVDLWLWTQVNRSTIEVVMDRLGEPMEKAHTVMDKWGYTGSACLPMALDDAVRAGRISRGDLLVLTGSGAGLAMGCVALRWTREREAERV
ncbi:MAG TPA: ketoacyl-ACP synthase III [Longimicrobiaceae bacterium]|jgi:3-oxoacyl-[acyl-carrier-protein] synthase-3|nr:ketoacyl-ACP synthase III [Longimicrobiaceae bacterium]